jgi:putative oxidoreductase
MTTRIEHQVSSPTLDGAGAKFERVLTTKVARALFALPFAFAGLGHFFNAGAMASAVPVPGGVFWVYFTGAALLAGAVGVLTGILGKWAAYGLAALMATFVLTVHLPGLSNPDMAQFAMVGAIKDTALMGAALAFAGIFAAKKQSA